MISAHGGALINRVLTGQAKLEAEEKALKGILPRLDIKREIAQDAENIATGIFSPLEGFLLKEQTDCVLECNKLPNGVDWTIPILLDVKEKKLENLVDSRGRKIGPGSEICLWYENKPVALMAIGEIYRYDQGKLARVVYGTTSPEHPGVAQVASMGEWIIGGKINLINSLTTPFAKYKYKPLETRSLFAGQGWETVAAFQTRNAPHIGHEYVQKTALTFVDGLFINPVLGKKKKGDFKDEVIIDTNQVLLNHYFRRDNTMLGILEYQMRYAGPKEAIHHAIMRKNFGCTHFIVGRDHAGVGSFYKPYEAQEFFNQFPNLGIVPIPFKSFFYCKKCEGVANDKTCPHDEIHRDSFSGTKIRNYFSGNSENVEGLMRPEVIDTIKKYHHPFVG